MTSLADVDTRPAVRVFVSPREPNTKFLVERGPDLPYGTNEMMRADINAEFHAGICRTRDPKAIKWLEAHAALVSEGEHAAYHLERGEDPEPCRDRGVCMDAAADQVALWADQEGRKLDLANREAQLPSDYDVEAVMQGKDPMGGTPGALMDRATAAMQAASRASEGSRITTNHPERFHPGQQDEGDGPPRGLE